MQLDRPLCFAACLLLVMFVDGPARATALLDTGTPTGVGNPLTIRNNSGYQTLAGAFSTAGPEVVDSVQTYLVKFDGSIDFLITGRTPGNLPDVNNTLFSQTLTLDSSTEDWYGPTGLNWALPAGDYYLVLPPTDND